MSEELYKEKYLKYKEKYLTLKNESEIRISNQIGGILTYNCNSFYKNVDSYCYNTNILMQRELTSILRTSNEWDNTVLYELEKIDFDIKRINELPEVVKLILNIKPKPSHLLEMILPKNFVELIRKVLLYERSRQTTIEYALSISIKKSFNPELLQYLEKIVCLNPAEINPEINSWIALNKLLEFISCLLNNREFKILFKSTYNTAIKNIKELPIEFELLNKIIEYPNYINNIYDPRDITTIDGVSLNYNNFLLMDFFSERNISNVLPPSALLLLSIKINEDINKRDNYYNDLLRKLLGYLRVECGYVERTPSLNAQTIEFNAEPIVGITTEDGVLLDTALNTIITNPVNQIDPTLNLINEVHNNLTILQKMSLMYNGILDNFNRSLTTSRDNLKNYLRRFNVLNRQNREERIVWLETEVRRLQKKIKAYQEELPAKSTTKLFGLIKSESDVITDKIKDKLTRVNQYNEEIRLLKGDIQHTNNSKINYILSKIIFVIGIGLNDLDKDICNAGRPASNIAWRTFDKLLKINEANIFKIIALTNSNILINLILQYVTAYSTFLPLDFKSYFYIKLNMNADQINTFNRKYQEFENNIYQNFIHDDGYYYNNIKQDGTTEKITNALTPPGELLNTISNIVNQ